MPEGKLKWLLNLIVQKQLIISVYQRKSKKKKLAKTKKLKSFIF